MVSILITSHAYIPVPCIAPDQLATTRYEISSTMLSVSLYFAISWVVHAILYIIYFAYRHISSMDALLGDYAKQNAKQRCTYLCDLYILRINVWYYFHMFGIDKGATIAQCINCVDASINISALYNFHETDISLVQLWLNSQLHDETRYSLFDMEIIRNHCIIDILAVQTLNCRIACVELNCQNVSCWIILERSHIMKNTTKHLI